MTLHRYVVGEIDEADGLFLYVVEAPSWVKAVQIVEEDRGLGRGEAVLVGDATTLAQYLLRLVKKNNLPDYAWEEK